CASAPPLRVIDFLLHQRLVTLSLGDDGEAIAIDENLGATSTAIVIRCHDESVGAHIEDGEQITGPHVLDIAVESEKIPALAHGANTVGANMAVVSAHCLDPVKGAVVRGPQQLGHPGIRDDILLPATVLAI